MEAGGYDSEKLWSKDDWAWKTAALIHHPGFWVRRDNAWHQRTMFTEIPLPMDWPVYVSQAEASAYARWVGKHCRPKRNGSVPRMARRKARNGNIRGVRNRHPQSEETLISSTGIRLLSERFPRAQAHLALRILRATAGNGRRRRLDLFPGSNRSRSIVDTPRTSSITSTSS